MEVDLGLGLIVLNWDPAPLPKRGQSPLPIFGPSLWWPNDWMHQDMPLGMEVGLRPGGFVLDGDSAPSPRRGRSPVPLPKFRPMSVMAKRLE